MGVEGDNVDCITDPMSVNWSNKCSENLEKLWKNIPELLRKPLISLLIFIFGISISGDWLSVLIHVGRQFGYIPRDASDNNTPRKFDWSKLSLESFYLRDLWNFLIPSIIISYTMYFGIGGILHWYFYIRQRDRPEEWKCQPTKWLTPELERHEILLGTSTLFLNATTSAFLSCYIYNGGYSTVYYNINEYGWLWFILQWPVVFIYTDYITYWAHRIYHTPFLYKHFHKLHHKYKQPTVFSVTAIHPIESLNIQLLDVAPLFLIPIHWVSFYTVALYVYYHGIVDHSGVNLKAYWWQPWQPDVIFHDNHHQYFHVNFGFNMSLWDKIHGTYRLKDRIYTEDIFYGKGKRINEVSAEVLKADLEEREAENPLAYRDNRLKFKLSQKELDDLINKIQ